MSEITGHPMKVIMTNMFLKIMDNLDAGLSASHAFPGEEPKAGFIEKTVLTSRSSTSFFMKENWLTRRSRSPLWFLKETS